MRLSLVLLVAGCTGEPGSPPDDTAADVPEICVGAPVVTWDNFGSGFTTQFCDSCHAATTLDRHGSPAEVMFDTEEEALSWADRILVRAGGATPTMPPMGGVSDEDRQLLEIWLTCGG